jgi:threonine/homoserine/homoserine lactone efflux protein
MAGIISASTQAALRFRGRRHYTEAMDPSAALLAGLAAGLAIAMQVGAVSLLLVEAAITAGPRAGAAAGIGVATVDLAFAAVAAVAGGAAGAAVSSHETEIRTVAAGVVAAIAIHGLVSSLRDRPAGSEGSTSTAGDRTSGHFTRFLMITAANPLTIASFAAVAAALSLDGPAAALAFTGGVGLASCAWHMVLALAAGHAGQWMTPRMRRGLTIVGRLAVLGIAAHLALGG